MQIIDFRCRPPSDYFLSYFDKPRVTWHGKRTGVKEVSPAFMTGSMELFWKEMDEAGVTVAVVLGRNSPAVFMGKQFNEARIPNEHLKELQEGHSDRIIGFAGIDVSGKSHDPVAETKRCIQELRLKGIFIEPGRSLDTSPADPRLWPIYETCLDLDIPVNIMSGPYAGRDINSTHPLYFDQVATRYPDLRIVVGHGAWPWVDEMIGVAFKHVNLFVSPDMYLFTPGASRYVEAANSVLKSQMLFASCYPLRPLKQTVEECKHLGLTDDALEHFMYKNAASLLRM